MSGWWLMPVVMNTVYGRDGEGGEVGDQLIDKLGR